MLVVGCSVLLQGLYIIIEMDWKCASIGVLAIPSTQKDVASDKKLQRLSWKRQWW